MPIQPNELKTKMTDGIYIDRVYIYDGEGLVRLMDGTYTEMRMDGK